MLLRCTARLLKLLAGRGGPLIDTAPGLDDWYANVLWIERRKCLLMIHADMLFSILDPDVRVAQFDDLGTYAATLIVDALASEGLVGTTLGPTDPDHVRLAKTASRSILGHLTEIAFEAQHTIATAGGLQHTDIGALNRRLRRSLRGRDGSYVVPLELAAARSA